MYQTKFSNAQHRALRFAIQCFINSCDNHESEFENPTMRSFIYRGTSSTLRDDIFKVLRFKIAVKYSYTLCTDCTFALNGRIKCTCDAITIKWLIFNNICAITVKCVEDMEGQTTVQDKKNKHLIWISMTRFSPHHYSHSGAYLK